MDFEKYSQIMKNQNRFVNKFNNTNIINYVVFIVITAVFLVNGIALYHYFRYGVETPTELIIAFNGFCGVELLGMAAISASKNKYKED